MAKIVTADELKEPLRSIDTSGWLGNSIYGWNVLCLGAAGGRHSALYHAAGAQVTVVDISDGMLDLDRFVTKELQIQVRLIQASMVHLPMLRNQEFDLVVHPVSTCYVDSIAPVFSEVSRVLKPDGLYVSQHKQPSNLQSSLWPIQGKYAYESEIGQPARRLAENETSPFREPNTIEFAHSLETILGGICRAGMCIEDIAEPCHAKDHAEPGSMGHRSRFIAPYIRVKARKPTSSVGHQTPKLLIP